MAMVYLSIGTNLGDRGTQLKTAVTLLRQFTEIDVICVSSIYETQPVGGVAQSDFLNIAVALKTQLDPKALLTKLHQVETTLHRQRLVHWGPRAIDLDIIFYDDMVSDDPVVTLPHPEVGNRLFVLIPLKEVSRQDPLIHTRVNQMIKTTTDRNWVRKFKDGEGL